MPASEGCMFHRASVAIGQRVLLVFGPRYLDVLFVQGTLSPRVTSQSCRSNYFDLTSPENPATARRLKAHPMTERK